MALFSSSTPLSNRTASKRTSEDDLMPRGHDLLQNFVSDDDDSSLADFLPPSASANWSLSKKRSSVVLADDSDNLEDSTKSVTKSPDDSVVCDSFVADSLSSMSLSEAQQSPLPSYNRYKDRSRSQLVPANKSNDSSHDDGSLLFSARTAKHKAKVTVESESEQSEQEEQPMNDEQENDSVPTRPEKHKRAVIEDDSLDGSGLAAKPSVDLGFDFGRPEYTETRGIDDDNVFVESDGEPSNKYESSGEEAVEHSDDSDHGARSPQSTVNTEALERRNELERKLESLQQRQKSNDLSKLPDEGAQLLNRIQMEIDQLNSNFGLESGGSVAAADGSELAAKPSVDFERPEYTEMRETDDDNDSDPGARGPPQTTVNTGALERRNELERKLGNLQQWQKSSDLSKLPDKGAKLLNRILEIEVEIEQLNSNFGLKSGGSAGVAESPESSREGGHSNKTVDLTDEEEEEDSSYAPSPDVPKSSGAAAADTPGYKRQLMERLYANAPVANRLYAGKMTDQKFREARTVTHDAVVKLHSSVTQAPLETDETEDPAGLVVSLMQHQRQALTWMLWREEQEPPGGILADDMGLGKTLSMISLILTQKLRLRERKEAGADFKTKLMNREGLVASNSTLVICPASVLDQWVKEIERRLKRARLTVCAFKGPKNKRESNPHRLSNYDVVVTSYQLVRNELLPNKKPIDMSKRSSDEDDSFQANKKSGSKSVLARVCWGRVILDEAHNIKNYDSQQSRAVCQLAASARWCLTGTPIHNNLFDFYSLIRFLRCAPFDELATWKIWIMEKNSAQSRERLNTLVKGLMLRRTKEQTNAVTGKPLLDLKPKRFETLTLTLNDAEKSVYEQLFKASQLRVREFVKTQEHRDNELVGVTTGKFTHQQLGYKNPFKGGARGAKNNEDRFQAMTCILVMLLRLRQACVHLALTKDAIDIEALKQEANAVGEDLTKEMAEMSLEEGDLTEDVNKSKQIEQLFQSDCLSTKLQSLMDHVIRITRESEDKCVIVSQWAQLLNIVQRHIDAMGIKYTRISGEVPQSQRQERVDAFNKPNAHPTLMLLSLTAGGVGLNLVGANHLFMLDLHWNPALEQQACDRIYRMGQTKEVFIYKLVCKDTIEERVLEMQKNKLELAKSVLDGAAAKNLNKLTLGDLKFLFQLDKPKVPSTDARAIRPMQQGTGAYNNPHF